MVQPLQALRTSEHMKVPYNYRWVLKRGYQILHPLGNRSYELVAFCKESRGYYLFLSVLSNPLHDFPLYAVSKAPLGVHFIDTIDYFLKE